MDLLLLLVLVLVVFAVFGGLVLSKFLWLLLIVALLVFIFSRRSTV